MYLGLVGHVVGPLLLHLECSLRQYANDEWSCVLIKLYLQKQDGGPDVPLLPTTVCHP